MTKLSFSSFLLCCLVFVILINGECILGMTSSKAHDNIYIVYLGERPHDDVNLLADSHHDMLASVVGSKESASKSMVYSYRHGFSGFAARLTESQAKLLSELPDVIDVLPNKLHKLHTTRSWDYLGFPLQPQSPNTLLEKANLGDGTIVGILDSGIYVAPSFSDEGLGPIPSRWKGYCVSGGAFKASTDCNKKLIGARMFKDGVEEETGMKPSPEFDDISPLDMEGHGTHVAATIAGSYVEGINYLGLADGTIRGGAPRARIAAYKVCWNTDVASKVCSSASVLRGFDEAMKDGVDLISVSLGTDTIDPLSLEVDKTRNPYAIGSFHAVSKGISVICSAGNSGPHPSSVINTAPWVITVGASTIDRTFPTPITLGNNRTFMGRSLKVADQEQDQFITMVYDPKSVHCEDLKLTRELVAGKVLLCFTVNAGFEIENTTLNLNDTGGAGLIIAKEYSDSLIPCSPNMPFVVEVDLDVGTEMLRYIRFCINAQSDPKVKVGMATTYQGKPAPPTKVAYFSARGPNSVAPVILKPDIIAPGVNILAPYGGKGYNMMSGTSMSAPHISGVVALLKALHPNWSPAAIKSAIMTTAWNTDPYGSPIYARETIATPFDMGAGLVNPNAAMYPGLVYELEPNDYLHYLCAMGYRKAGISRIAQSKSVSCPKESTSDKLSELLDLNLPSITIPYLSCDQPTTVNRTLTNVGAVDSVYKVVVKPPMGIDVTVEPKELVFNNVTRQNSFAVTFRSTSTATTMYNYGSLTWTDGTHYVTSPLSVRVELEHFT